MKKVYVVTVFNSLNSGSFLQATSLYKAISAMGYDVAFLDTGARNLWKRAGLEAVFMLKKLNCKAAVGKFVQAKKLTDELKNYKVVKLKNLKDTPESVYVLGSDEIWNVARADMAKYPIFWGIGLPLERCISYAPSINISKEEHVKKYDFVKESLEHLFAISVRDHHSYETLKTVTDRDIAEVCDPTLLLKEESYYSLKSSKKLDNYILVYIYAKLFKDEDIQELKRFAREKNKKLVAFGSNFSWCDINVNGAPWDFLSYIEGADYVCTGTFHGTLFSSLFRKNFVVVGGNNRKVNELLDKFELSDRKVNAANMRQVFEKGYDRDALTAKIASMREAGLDYLKDNIDKIYGIGRGKWQRKK